MPMHSGASGRRLVAEGANSRGVTVEAMLAADSLPVRDGKESCPAAWPGFHGGVGTASTIDYGCYKLVCRDPPAVPTGASGRLVSTPGGGDRSRSEIQRSAPSIREHLQRRTVRVQTRAPASSPSVANKVALRFGGSCFLFRAAGVGLHPRRSRRRHYRRRPRAAGSGACPTHFVTLAVRQHWLVFKRRLARLALRFPRPSRSLNLARDAIKAHADAALAIEYAPYTTLVFLVGWAAEADLRCAGRPLRRVRGC